MLTSRVKQLLVETIKKETEKALKEGDDAYLIDLQNARKLILKGAWKVRKDNPYLYFMEECLLGKGGTLRDTQEAMQECALAWRELPIEKRREYEARAKGKAVYDYL